jgi:hypothetical protein
MPHLDISMNRFPTCDDVTNVHADHVLHVRTLPADINGVLPKAHSLDLELERAQMRSEAKGMELARASRQPNGASSSILRIFFHPPPKPPHGCMIKVCKLAVGPRDLIAAKRITCRMALRCGLPRRLVKVGLENLQYKAGDQILFEGEPYVVESGPHRPRVAPYGTERRHVFYLVVRKLSNRSLWRTSHKRVGELHRGRRE